MADEKLQSRETCPRCEAEVERDKVRCHECGQILDGDGAFPQRPMVIRTPVQTPARIQQHRGLAG